MRRKAAWVHRNGPVRLTFTTACHCSKLRSSIGTAGVLMPALLKSTSSRPKVFSVASNSAFTEAGSPTSVGTASMRLPSAPAFAMVCCSASSRRPASTTW